MGTKTGNIFTHNQNTSPLNFRNKKNSSFLKNLIILSSSSLIRSSSSISHEEGRNFPFLHRLKNKEWNWIELFDYTSMVGALKHKSVLSSRMKFFSSPFFMRIRTFASKRDNENKIHWWKCCCREEWGKRKTFYVILIDFFVHHVVDDDVFVVALRTQLADKMN